MLDIRCGLGVKIVVAAVLAGCWGNSLAAELSYTLQSPLVGGTNPYLMQAENQRVQAVRQAEATAKAEAKSAQADARRLAENTPAARFARALESQLYYSVANRLSQDLATLPDGGTGSFRTGDTTIEYRNSNGTLYITITTPTGTSTLELPST